jgi:uncharacterized protein
LNLISDEDCRRYLCLHKRGAEGEIGSGIGGTPHRIARHLLKSTATEQQLFEVLARPYFVPLIPAVTHEWLVRLMAAEEAVTIGERIAACRDPTDDKFLELAANGRADLIVTGDPDLLVLGRFRKIRIVAPAAFVKTTSR